MDYNAIASLILRVGVEPAIIAALLYLVYKLIGDLHGSMNDLTCSLNDNTSALDKLVEYTRGRHDA